MFYPSFSDPPDTGRLVQVSNFLSSLAPLEHHFLLAVSNAEDIPRQKKYIMGGENRIIFTSTVNLPQFSYFYNSVHGI